MGYARLGFLFLLGIATSACGTPPASKTAEAAEVGPKANDAPKDDHDAAPALPPGTVAREEVDRVLLRGPARLLSRIQMEEVLRQNKFVGWRLISFPAEWDQAGLQPGDVVTDVNGTSLEQADDLWTAWKGAATASTITLTLERNGAPAVTALKIHGEPAPKTLEALENGSSTESQESATPTAQGKSRFQTKVIGGDDPIETE